MASLSFPNFFPPTDCLADNTLCTKQMIKAIICLALGIAATILVSYLGAYHTANPAIQPIPETADGNSAHFDYLVEMDTFRIQADDSRAHRIAF
jgi:hypothetical protein